MDESAAAWLVKRHGSRTDAVLDLIRAEPTLAERLHAQTPFVRAEVVFAASEEMALTLADVLRRRLPVMLMLPPGRAVARLAAELMAPVLGWDKAETESQCVDALSLWPTIAPRS